MGGVPFTVPGEYDDMSAAGTPIMVEDDAMGMQMMSAGSPHITFAGAILALLGLKFFSESSLLSLDPAEVKVSLFNIVNVGLQASVFIVGAKVTSAWLLRKGVMVPGLADFVGSL
jgi:hypothetical protein